MALAMLSPRDLFPKGRSASKDSKHLLKACSLCLVTAPNLHPSLESAPRAFVLFLLVTGSGAVYLRENSMDQAGQT